MRGLRTLGALGLGIVLMVNPQPAHASETRSFTMHHEAPVGYDYSVSTANLYMFRDLRHEDGRPGVWNADERGNRRGTSFFTTKHHPMTIRLGVNDHRQGDTAPASDGLVAWRKHGIVRVSDHNRRHGEGVYRYHGYVAEVDATVQTGGRTFYVIANAIWR